MRQAGADAQLVLEVVAELEVIAPVADALSWMSGSKLEAAPCCTKPAPMRCGASGSRWWRWWRWSSWSAELAVVAVPACSRPRCPARRGGAGAARGGRSGPVVVADLMRCPPGRARDRGIPNRRLGHGGRDVEQQALSLCRCLELVLTESANPCVRLYKLRTLRTFLRVSRR
jgi:hypothetical protein